MTKGPPRQCIMEFAVPMLTGSLAQQLYSTAAPSPPASTRVPVAYLLAYLTRCPKWPNGQPEALSVSLRVPWVPGAVISAVAFRRGKWQRSLAVQSFRQE